MDGTASVPGVRILPLRGLPEVRRGDDLPRLLLDALEEAGEQLRDGDVLCISTKIISKARGLVIRPEQKESAISAQSVRTVARRRHGSRVTSIVQIPAGPVMAAAGIDGSNAPGGLLLLPEDPDAEARALARALIAATGARIGVVLTDTSSRIWRVGVADIALGAAGVRSLQDLRGTADADGRTLAVTVRNLADELAAAADLAKGKAEGVPAAIVRGVVGAVVPLEEGTPARELSRSGDGDWFPRPSLESVWQALGVPAHREPVAAMDVEEDAVRIARALETAAAAEPALPAGARLLADAGPATIEVRPSRLDDADPAGPEEWAAAGALAERIRIALGAESIARPLPPVAIRLVFGAHGAVDAVPDPAAGADALAPAAAGPAVACPDPAAPEETLR